MAGPFRAPAGPCATRTGAEGGGAAPAPAADCRWALAVAGAPRPRRGFPPAAAGLPMAGLPSRRPHRGKRRRPSDQPV